MLLRRSALGRRNPLTPMTRVATGLFLVACGLIWPRVTFLHGSMSASGVDFIQGFAVGIGIACEVMGVTGLLTGWRRKSDPSVTPRD